MTTQSAIEQAQVRWGQRAFATRDDRYKLACAVGYFEPPRFDDFRGPTHAMARVMGIAPTFTGAFRAADRMTLGLASAAPPQIGELKP